MTFFLIIIAYLIGYCAGHYLWPKRQIRDTVRELREKCKIALDDGRKGMYKTTVTDQNKSSELVVEVMEKAVTTTGLTKVEYRDAFYKNPAFRNKKGKALLNEVRGLLGDYLPYEDIEWYEEHRQKEKISKFMSELDLAYKR